jgi:hypothetical protein
MKMPADTAPVAAPKAPPDTDPAEEQPPPTGDGQEISGEGAASAKAEKPEKPEKPEKTAKPSKKAGKKAKGKKGESEDTASPAGGGLSLAAHPRAARRLAEAKAWGALGGFVLGGYLSLPTHTLLAAGVRALAAGVVCWVVVWALAVFLWRRLVVAELRHAEHELVAARIAKLNPAERMQTLNSGER